MNAMRLLAGLGAALLVVLSAGSVAGGAARAVAAADEPTTLTVTDKVAVADVVPFGIVLGDDGSFTKERLPHGGFEGTIYRTIGFGPAGGATWYFDWFGIGPWRRIAKGATYRFVGGRRKGVTGRIVDVVDEAYPPRPDKGKMTKYVFDKPGPVPGANDGILIERVDDRTGFLGQHGGGYWVFLRGGATVRTEPGDVRPASRGKVAAVLAAPGKAVAELMAPIGDLRQMELAGTWRLSFWAKGTGRLLVALGNWFHRGQGAIQPREVPLTPDWRQHRVTFTLAAYPTGSNWGGSLALDLQLTGGTCKLDELSMVLEGDKNPSAFRDHLVAALKRLRPGIVRHLQMGGGSLDNLLAPPEARMTSNCFRRATPPDGNWPAHPRVNGAADITRFGLHEFLGLCEEVGTEPWYCLPGAIYVEEMKNFMEYLGGPVSTKYGKVRADLGHRRPWTETFRRIHVEIGNEAWNYLCTGFEGPEYWQDLFTAAKASPYYKPGQFRFHAGGQAVWVGRNTTVARRHPAADAVSVAPYVIHQMSKAQAAAMASDEKLFSWAFGYTWYHARRGYMAANYAEVTRKLHKPLSIYEVNHHITGGDAPPELRNRVVTSIGGGLNIANWMLLMLREQKIREHCMFTLSQLAYGKVRLWGTAVCMKPGAERYRPTFLAEMLINRVLRGDLVEVTKSGRDPKWTCMGVYDKNKPFEVPYVHAYATRDGPTRGLIVFNLHRTRELPVRLALPSKVRRGSATRWTLAADSIGADNEPEHEPQVKVVEQRLADLAPEAALKLRPFSMTVLRWQAAPPAQR